MKPSVSSAPKALPLGKMIVFITIGVSAAICPRAKPLSASDGNPWKPCFSLLRLAHLVGHSWRANPGYFSRVPTGYASSEGRGLHNNVVIYVELKAGKCSARHIMS